MITYPNKDEPPFAWHDGWGGKEWCFTVSGIQYNEFRSEAEALKEYDRRLRAREEAELRTFLPSADVDVMKLKGMV